MVAWDKELPSKFVIKVTLINVGLSSSNGVWYERNMLEHIVWLFCNFFNMMYIQLFLFSSRFVPKIYFTQHASVRCVLIHVRL